MILPHPHYATLKTTQICKKLNKIPFYTSVINHLPLNYILYLHNSYQLLSQVVRLEDIITIGQIQTARINSSF